MDATLIANLKKDHEEIITFLKSKNILLPDLPTILSEERDERETFAIAYPIQGMLKYHGLSDPLERTAFFPSISLCNNAFATITYLNLDPTLAKDEYIVNGILVQGEDYDRIRKTLSSIRKNVKNDVKVRLISRNIKNSNQQTVFGKGIGTSASAGASITHGLMHLLYKQTPPLEQNRRLLSILARSFAGSATRSVVGGIGLWFNYPKIPSIDSFAIRIDEMAKPDFIQSISLITFEIASQIRTQMAHNIVIQSPFYNEWVKTRKNCCIELINALVSHDFETIGKLTEFDTFCLNSVTQTADFHHPLILWSSLTLELIRYTLQLREEGIPVYFSIDTGPSVVLITLKKVENRVLQAFKNQFPTLTPSIGGIGGPSEILTSKSPLIKPLLNDIETLERRSKA